MFFIFNAWDLFGELKRTTSLDLSGTYQGDPRTRPPCCTVPQQPNMHISALNGCLILVSVLYCDTISLNFFALPSVSKYE